MKNRNVNRAIKWIRLCLILGILFAIHFESAAQMPPPGYERAKKMQAEQVKMLSIDRDSMTLVDTVMIFDPNTYESEVQIIEHRISIRDYCTTMLGMDKPEILLDHQPHVIIDPKTYEDITVRLKENGTLEILKQ